MSAKLRQPGLRCVTAPRRAAIYVRISRDREGRELGVERQEQDCRALAGRLGFVVVEVFRDNDLSASTRSRKPRPGYQRMIKDAKDGRFEVIIAYASGRLTRRPREHEDLIELAERHGIEFCFVASPSFDLNTSAGRRIARILAANDAGEAEDISERGMRQKRQAAEQGWWKGGRRPYGYGVEIGRDPQTGKPIFDFNKVVPEEAAEVLRMSHAVLTGVSLRSLAVELNARGVPMSSGKKWRQDSVRQVLLRPRNAGLMQHQGEVIGPASWPAIVPEEVWRAVVAKLTDPGRRTNVGAIRRWLGSGLYLCGVCDDGTTVRAHCATLKRPGTRPVYTCREHRHLIRTCADVDELVEAAVIERLSRPDAIDLLAPPTGGGVDIPELRTQALVLRTRLDEMAREFAENDLADVREYRIATEGVRQRLASVEAALADVGRESVLSGLVGADDVELAWKGIKDITRRQAIVDALMTVVLHSSGQGRPHGWSPGQSYFRPESVKIIPKH